MNSKKKAEEKLKVGSIRSPTNKSTPKATRENDVLPGRPYPRFSQDFSGESKTDTSFAPACDVNNIVKHYESTGLDLYQDRKNLERFGEASTMSFADAMRMKAELDSNFAALPESERQRHENSPEAWLEYLASEPAPEDLSEPPADSPAEPAPQDAADANSEA